MKCPHIKQAPERFFALLTMKESTTDSMNMNLSRLWEIEKDSEGKESLACCSPWGHKESDTTE